MTKRYRVKVTEIGAEGAISDEGVSYECERKLYAQTFDNLTLSEVVIFLNNNWPDPEPQ